MVRAWAIAMLLLAGCHRVFDLEEVAPVPPPPDAPVTPMYCYPFAVDAAVGSDPDLDFVPSQDDNCPEGTNKDQADEDGDCRGDVCDRCPWIDSVDPDMGDADGDTIGDSCDPAPFVVNQFFFDGFNDDSATILARYSATGTWTEKSGSWAQTENGLALAWHNGGYAVSGVVHLSVFVPGGNLYNIGATFMVGAWVLGFGDQAGHAGIRAGLVREQTNLWLRIERVQNGTVTLLAQQQVMIEDLPSLLRISVGYNVQEAVVELQTTTGILRTSATFGLGGGYAGPFTLDTPADFQYFTHMY